MAVAWSTESAEALAGDVRAFRRRFAKLPVDRSRYHEWLRFECDIVTAYVIAQRGFIATQGKILASVQAGGVGAGESRRHSLVLFEQLALLHEVLTDVERVVRQLK